MIKYLFFSVPYSLSQLFAKTGTSGIFFSWNKSPFQAEQGQGDAHRKVILKKVFVRNCVLHVLEVFYPNAPGQNMDNKTQQKRNKRMCVGFVMLAIIHPLRTMQLCQEVDEQNSHFQT